MVYPSEFSAQARTRVELEETLASQEFDRARDRLPWRSYGPHEKLQELLREYILRVWVVFVEEACKLGRARIWDLARVKGTSIEFLNLLTLKAWSEKGFDSGGTAYRGQIRQIRKMTSHLNGAILMDVMREFERSAQWQSYGELVRSVADAWARDAVDADTTAATEQLSWEDIEISFLSDERVQVKVSGQVHTCNYAEMGFQDNRSGKANQAWGLLRTLARADGGIPGPVTNSRDFVAMGKRFERLRSTLRKYFRIPSDPISRDPANGYQCRFKIRCAVSFER